MLRFIKCSELFGPIIALTNAAVFLMSTYLNSG